MTANEHLLLKLNEECLEVAHRVTKAMRFGITEIQPHQILNNAERIQEEFAGILAAYNKCVAAGLLAMPHVDQITAAAAKQDKYFEYSKECGTVSNHEGGHRL